MTRFRGGRQQVKKKRYFFFGVLVWVEEEGRILAGVPFLLYRPRPISSSLPSGRREAPKKLSLGSSGA